MKKILLFAVAGLLIHSVAAQTAVNFTVNDCNSTNHDLFSELNSGKVIVITWVMPCSACIGVASSAANTVRGYSTSNPGMVKFYLTDDVANTSCSTLTSWATTNTILTDAVFSNAAISMSDYGSAGMQKTVILGGANHHVYYNVIGAVTASAMQAAINSALTASGIAENSLGNFELSMYPNPVSNGKSTLTYTLTQTSNVTINVYNVLGASVINSTNEKQTIGKHETVIDFETLTKGIYFVKLTSGDASQMVKFAVTH